MLGKRRFIIMMALLAMNTINNEKLKATGSKGNTLNLPSFKNVLEIKSSIDGRIRFSSPLVKSNDEMAYHLKDQISKIPVIKKCTINTLTATILIEYDSQELDAQTLEGAIIKLLGADEMLTNGRVSSVRKFINEGRTALNNGIYDFTKGAFDTTTLFAILLLFGAIWDYRKVGRRPIPAYPTLLWWTSRLLQEKYV